MTTRFEPELEGVSTDANKTLRSQQLVCGLVGFIEVFVWLRGLRSSRETTILD